MIRQVRTYLKWWKVWRSLPIRAWVRGAEAYRLGNFARAESLYEEGLQKYSQHKAAYTARLDYAYCLFKNGKLNHAEEQLRFAIAERPDGQEGYLRLGRLQLWAGQPLEAAWTMRRALQETKASAESVGTFIIAVLENGGPAYLLQEAMNSANRLLPSDRTHPLLEVAIARYAAQYGDAEEGRRCLARLATEEKASFDAVVAYADCILMEGDLVQARYHLRRALTVAPNHPRVLSLLAESYLMPGEHYNPQYAVQLALQACQSTTWLSPREMHILAEAYQTSGDKMAALLIASKAKDVGNRLMGAYPQITSLDQLIESLSSGTQA